LSAIVNLEVHHTLEDLEPIKKYLEETFGTKVYQMAIHRDEGKLISQLDGTEFYSGKNFFLNHDDQQLYFDKKFTKLVPMDEYEIQKNYHAHIEMMGLDIDGNAIRQKMNRTALQILQTFTASTLKMQRGQETVSYTKEQMREITAIVGKKSDYESTTLYAQKFNEVAKDLGYFVEKKKRKDTHAFKDAGANREQAKRDTLAKQATEKDLKEEIAKLREELKANHAERKDYAELEQLNRDLKEQLKNRDLTIESLHQQINALKQQIETLKSENETLREEIVKKDEIINSTPNMDDYKEYAEKEFVDFKPIPIPKIVKQTVEIKTGMLSSEPAKVLMLEEANKLISYTNAISNQNKELHAQNQALKTENSKLKQAYTNLVAKLKEITKFDKVVDAVEAIKQRFIKSSVKQQVEEHKELDTLDKLNKLVQEIKPQSHVRKNRG